MRATTLVLGLLLMGTSLLAVAPSAAAFDWCVEGTHKDCHSHVFCIGRSWDSRGERCNVGMEHLCAYDCHRMLLP